MTNRWDILDEANMRLLNSSIRRLPNAINQKRAYSSQKNRDGELSSSDERQKIIIGGAAAQANVLDIVAINPNLAKKITLISARPWMLDIHPDWNNRPWGQSVRYLPSVTRKIATTLFPDYPDDELMTFGMINAIFNAQQTKVATSGIRFIQDEVESIEQNTRGLIAHCNGKEIPLTTNQNFHILHAGHIPAAPAGLKVNHFGKAYSMPKTDEPEPIVVVGAGLSLTWALRDLTETPIIHVIPPGDRVRRDLENLLHAAIRLEDAEVQALSDDTVLITGRNVFDNKWIQMRVEQSRVYSAMGSRLNRKLVDKVDARQVSYLDAMSNSGGLETFFGFSSSQGAIRATGTRATVVPEGSYLINFFKIQQQLGTFTPTETNSVLLITAWEKAVIQKLEAVNISINPKFFNHIENRIKHIFEKHVPTEEQIWVVIQNTYLKHDPDEISGEQQHMATYKDGEPVSWESFKEIIIQPTEAIIKTAPITEETNSKQQFNR